MRNLIRIMAIVVTSSVISSCSMFLVNSTDEKTLGQVEYINEKILNIAIELNHRLREFTPGDKVVAVTTFVA